MKTNLFLPLLTTALFASGSSLTFAQSDTSNIQKLPPPINADGNAKEATGTGEAASNGSFKAGDSSSQGSKKDSSAANGSTTEKPKAPHDGTTSDAKKTPPTNGTSNNGITLDKDKTNTPDGKTNDTPAKKAK